MNREFEMQATTKEWFEDHYVRAAAQIVAFFDEVGLSLAGKRVIDIGCGDGLTGVGLCRLVGPASLTGYDIAPGDVAALRQSLSNAGVNENLPDGFSLQRSEPTTLPCRTASVDFAISWSAFQRVQDPPALLRDIYRCLTDDGLLFIQVWPLFWSQHGTHLWQWFPDGYANQRFSVSEIEDRLVADTDTDAEWKAMMLDAFATLNRYTFRDYEQALLESGFEIVRLELMCDVITVPRDAYWVSALDRSVSGFKLLAAKTA